MIVRMLKHVPPRIHLFIDVVGIVKTFQLKKSRFIKYSFIARDVIRPVFYNEGHGFTEDSK